MWLLQTEGERCLMIIHIYAGGGLNHESKEKVLDTKLYTVHSGEIRQEYPYRHCYSSCSLQTSIEEQGEEGLLQGTDSC